MEGSFLPGCQNGTSFPTGFRIQGSNRLFLGILQWMPIISEHKRFADISGLNFGFTTYSWGIKGYMLNPAKNFQGQKL